MNLLKSSRLMFYDTSEHPEQGCGSNGEEHVLSEREKTNWNNWQQNRTNDCRNSAIYISRALSLSIYILAVEYVWIYQKIKAKFGSKLTF